jgi:hypothetical protein
MRGKATNERSASAACACKAASMPPRPATKRYIQYKWEHSSVRVPWSAMTNTVWWCVEFKSA